MRNHEEVVAFTCGLLPDPSSLVDIAYMMLINETTYPLSTSDNAVLFNAETFPETTHFLNAVLLESLYRESNIPLPGNPFHNQFFNYYEGRDTKNLPIYRPSRVYVFTYVRELQLGEMNKYHDITESIIYISEEDPESAKSKLHICCKISENQPITKLTMYYVTIANTTEPCVLKISEKNFRIILRWVGMPSRVMAHLMEPISQATAVDHMEIEYTSLVGVKSFNLENKAASLLHLSFSYVLMDPELCTSLMKQIPSLINLKSLIIETASNWQGREYCRIPTDLCPEIFRSISHFHHLIKLDVPCNNLAGCLPDFLSDSDSVLPSLQSLDLSHTALTVHDVNHLMYIIETGKLPNLKWLDLQILSELEEEVDRLINTVMTHHKKELEITLSREDFPQHLLEKWETQCSGTPIRLRIFPF